jgi:hypothetical protein
MKNNFTKKISFIIFFFTGPVQVTIRKCFSSSSIPNPQKGSDFCYPGVLEQVGQVGQYKFDFCICYSDLCNSALIFKPAILLLMLALGFTLYF